MCPTVHQDPIAAKYLQEKTLVNMNINEGGSIIIFSTQHHHQYPIPKGSCKIGVSLLFYMDMVVILHNLIKFSFWH